MNYIDWNLLHFYFQNKMMINFLIINVNIMKIMKIMKIIINNNKWIYLKYFYENIHWFKIIKIYIYLLFWIIYWKYRLNYHFKLIIRILIYIIGKNIYNNIFHHLSDHIIYPIKFKKFPHSHSKDDSNHCEWKYFIWNKIQSYFTIYSIVSDFKYSNCYNLIQHS